MTERWLKTRGRARSNSPMSSTGARYQLMHMRGAVGAATRKTEPVASTSTVTPLRTLVARVTLADP